MGESCTPAPRAGDDLRRGARVTRFLIAGAGGMLGTAMQRILSERGVEFSAPPEAEFNIANEEQVKARVGEFVRSLGFGERGVLLNAAAYTNVERAEEDRNTAHAVNALAPVYLAWPPARWPDPRSRFDRLRIRRHQGRSLRRGGRDESTVGYGRTKLVGRADGSRGLRGRRRGTLIVRTAWVFGPTAPTSPMRILEVARERGGSRSSRTRSDRLPTHWTGPRNPRTRSTLTLPGRSTWRVQARARATRWRSRSSARRSRRRCWRTGDE